MQTCIRCHQRKPFTEFYPHPTMQTGYLGKCKACCKEQARERHAHLMATNPEWVMAERERNRERIANKRRAGMVTPNRAAHNAASRKWSRANPSKRKAQGEAARAAKKGLIHRPGACEACGNPPPLQKHHHDYGSGTEVIWVCSGCHGKLHRKINPTL